MTIEPAHRFRTVLLIALAFGSAAAADWPHWRGPNRDGRTTEFSGWEQGTWPAAKPAWSTQVGEGCTSPVVVDDKLYTLGWSDEKDHVRCLDAETGESLWSVSYPCPRFGRHAVGDQDAYSGPTATPEYDSATRFLYTLSADGDLNCWDSSARGRRVWGVNLYDQYKAPRRPNVGKPGTQRDYGYVTAPIVQGDWLLVAVGADEGGVMAFDKRDGQRRWTSEMTEPAGHCGGMSPMSVNELPCLAVLTLRKLVVIRLDAGHEGKTLAEFPWETDFGNNIASPAVHGNSVLITSAYNHRTICRVAITPGQAKKVWEQPYASGTCTPVIVGNRVYWAWEKMRCLDFDTGNLLWEGGNFGSPGSCIATADHRVIVWGGNGRLALVEQAERSPHRYTELARAGRVSTTSAWPHVALAAGKVFCKDRDGKITAFRLAKSEP